MHTLHCPRTLVIAFKKNHSRVLESFVIRVKGALRWRQGSKIIEKGLYNFIYFVLLIT